MLNFRRVDRLEWVEKILVVPRRVRPPFDTQLGDGIGETETIHPHPDGTDNAGLVGVDILCRRRDVVATRGTDVASHRVDWNLGMFLTQSLNLVVHLARLHRTATRTVDLHDHPDRFLILERFAQRLDHILGAGLGATGDQPVNPDQRGVTLAATGGGIETIRPSQYQQQHQI